jgi:hypothetical protein
LKSENIEGSSFPFSSCFAGINLVFLKKIMLKAALLLPGMNGCKLASQNTIQNDPFFWSNFLPLGNVNFTWFEIVGIFLCGSGPVPHWIETTRDSLYFVHSFQFFPAMFECLESQLLCLTANQFPDGQRLKQVY